MNSSQTSQVAIVADLPATSADNLARIGRELEGQAYAAFWVGDLDIYAARSSEEAYELHIDLCGEEARDDFAMSDVQPVDAMILAMPCVDEDGQECPSIGEDLAATTEPGWLWGSE